MLDSVYGMYYIHSNAPPSGHMESEMERTPSDFLRERHLNDLAGELRELTDDELDDARHAVVWDVLMGKTVGGFDLKACLDCEFNSDGYTSTVNDLAALMVGDSALSPDDQKIMLSCAVHDLAWRIVEKHIPESAVEDRAREIAEDARRGL